MARVRQGRSQLPTPQPSPPATRLPMRRPRPRRRRGFARPGRLALDRARPPGLRRSRRRPGPASRAVAADALDQGFEDCGCAIPFVADAIARPEVAPDVDRAPAGDPDIDETDRLFAGTAVGTRDPGDGPRNVGTEARQDALRHGPCDL